MSKKHDTFPGEQPEMPVRTGPPEISQPHDPKDQDVPDEDPQVVPDEFPPEGNPPEEPTSNPADS